jgi:hypothetical protein
MGGSPPSPPTLDTAKSEKLTRADYQLKEEFTPRLTAAAGKSSRDEYTKNLQFALGQISDKSIGQRYDQAMPEVAQRRRELLQQIDGSQASSAEYGRLQNALRQGVTAQQAGMERMQAQETGQGALGGRLMQEAMAKMEQGGQLSPEAARDATQAARSGMAARGMATGNAGVAAELLNRDRYSRQREFENLGFAQNVEAADLGRRTQNTMNRQQAGMQNAQAFNQLSQFNTLQRSDTDRFNVGLLGQSAGLADAERARRLGLRQDGYNFALGSNPAMMALGLGSGYANMTQPAMGLMGGQNMQAMYSGGSPGTRGENMQLMGTLGGGALAAGGMVAGAVII